jgi:RNA polymerase sigma-70 factor (ECF subfamily)
MSNGSKVGAMGSEDLASFCRHEWPRLVGAMSLYTGRRDLAEELAQEALARVCRDWSKVRLADQPSAWAYRVAINLARSHWRRGAASRRAHTRLAARPPADVVGDGTDVIAVRDAVAALPARQRAALVLRYFAEFSVREAAEALRCPEGTIKSLTHAAIRTLRRESLLSDEPLMPTTTRDDG